MVMNCIIVLRIPIIMIIIIIVSLIYMLPISKWIQLISTTYHSISIIINIDESKKNEGKINLYYQLFFLYIIKLLSFALLIVKIDVEGLLYLVCLSGI